MAKVLTETAITTRNARAKLDPGLYWKGIDPETHLGYRKGKHGGTWLVRWRQRPGYRQAPLGPADDKIAEGTLSYDAACRAARDKVEEERKAAKAATDGPALTVHDVVLAYVAERDKREARRRGRKVRSGAAHRLSRYVLGQNARGMQEAIEPAPLASVPLHALSEDDLLRWRNDLPETLKASSRQRLINDLKAALNGAYSMHRRRLDASLPAIIKHGLAANGNGNDDDAEPVARDNQILTDAQVANLLRAARDVDAEQEWGGDLYRMAVVLAATGARFSQVARLRVGDCQIKTNRLMVPTSRKGRGKKAEATPVPVGKDVLEALLAVTNRATNAPLLERWRHKPAPGGIEWQRHRRGPWQTASEMKRAWEAIRERAKMPEVIPYALRHSSIVRGIKAGLPIRLVAALHDTSVVMIERHYSRWITSGLEELAAKAVVPLLPQDKEVVSLKRVG
jgi:integrase